MMPELQRVICFSSGACVEFFADGNDLPGGIADEPAITKRVRRLEASAARPVRPASSASARKAPLADQRHIAIEHQNDAPERLERGFAISTAWPVPAGLAEPRSAPRGRRGAPPPQRLPFGSHHHHRLGRRQPRAAWRTCPSRLLPAAWCMTFGNADFIRVPLPAAIG